MQPVSRATRPRGVPRGRASRPRLLKGRPDTVGVRTARSPRYGRGPGSGGRAAGPGDDLAQEEGAQPPGQRGATAGQDAGAGGLHDAPVGDAGGAYGLAVAALEAEVQVCEGARRGLDPLLGERPYEVQPPAGRLRL